MSSRQTSTSIEYEVIASVASGAKVRVSAENVKKEG
jgi:hypothetical protein